MTITLILLSFSLLTNFAFGQDFQSVCKQEDEKSSNISLFHCGQSAIPKSIKRLMGLNEVLGKKHCRQYAMEAKMNKVKGSELDLMIFDRKRETSRPLKCYCQDKLGKGLCSNKESFHEKLNKFNMPFKVKAWGNFVKDLFEQSSRGGDNCIKAVESSLNDTGCFEEVNNIHKSSLLGLNFIGRDGEVLQSENLTILFSNLTKAVEVNKGKVLEPISSYFKTSETTAFLSKHVSGNIDEFMGLSTTSYERKLSELGIDHHLNKLRDVLNSDSPETSLRENFKGGIDFFTVAAGEENEDLDSKISLGSHPDLKWLFTGKEAFNNADRNIQSAKFLKLSAIAKSNPFLSFKELRKKFEESEGIHCGKLIEKVTDICKMDGSQNLSIAKGLIVNGEIEESLGFITKDATNSESYKLDKIKDEISCFQFPADFTSKPTSFSELVERSIDKKVMLDSAVLAISEIESEVDTAINRVEGFERIAERIGKGKAEGKELEKVEALEEDFKGFLSGLKLPSGRNFTYPSGMDPAQAVANYKSEVYKWADDAVEKRISNIQGETDRIVNSDLPPLEKKKKLKELLSEVERLNKGEFLEEIYREKQNIGEYIARYEDKKKDWEAQYGEEAKENPKAVQAVAPPRNKTRSTGRGGSNSYKNVAGNSSNFVGGSDSAPSSSGVDNATAYIPPAPSVPFAQGSLMTRIVPKDEFQNNTVKASLLAKHKGYPIAVLDEKALKVELYTPKGGTSYKLQETLTISEAEARGYVFPDDVKKLVDGYKKDKSKGRAPASYMDYSPTKADLLEKKKKLEKLQSLSDVMERQGVPRRARVVRLNAILDNF